MSEPVGAHEMSEAEGLDEWRFLLGGIEASFRARPRPGAPGFATAAAFVLRIAEAADAADHHPDVDLRYPGVVHVTLTTHAVGGLSDLDLHLARTISDLARADGLTAEPGATDRIEVAIDAMDIAAVRPFWMAVLGYRSEGDDPSPPAIVDPQRRGPAVWFQQMDTPRTERNRLHIDVTVPHDQAEARIAAALAAGGVMRSDARARAFWVLADPEGNEACICTWQDRGPSRP